MNKLKFLSADKSVREIYNMRQQQKNDHNSELTAAKEAGLVEGEKVGLKKGLVEGEKVGLKKGLVEGEKKAKIESARKMLIDGLPVDMSKEALLHAEIYKKNNIFNILHATDDAIVEFSSKDRILEPLLDDLAQIAGINIQTTKSCNISEIAKILQNKNAVFLEKEGALCTGATKGDAEAVAMVLRKGCLADFYSNAMKLTDKLSLIDAYIQRIVYKNKYSKMKDK